MGHGRRLSFAVSLAALIVGQTIMWVLAPLSRASGTFAASEGLPIIAPDSSLYLRPSTYSEVFALPWTRWGYPALLQLRPESLEPAIAAVIINALAFVVAGAFLFHVTRRLAGTLAAAMSVSVLSVNPMTAQWVRMVLTESVFFASVVIVCSLSIRLLSPRPRKLDAVAMVLVAVFATTTRPNGFLVLFSALVVVALMSIRRLGARIAVMALLAVSMLPIGLLAYSASGPPSEGSLTSQIYAGVVIEGTEHVRTTIQMPEPLLADDESLRGAMRYILAHPFSTLRLGIARLAAESLQVRRHYPLVVNLGFGIGILGLILAAAAGWRDDRASLARRVFLIIALPLMLLTMATFAVPESRYGWAYLLPSSPIAGIGADRFLAWLSKKRSDTVGRVESDPLSLGER